MDRVSLASTTAVVELVSAAAAGGPGTALALHGTPGSGAVAMAQDAAQLLRQRGVAVHVVAPIDAATRQMHLTARRLRESHVLLLAGEDDRAGDDELVAALRARRVPVAPLSLADVVRVLADAAAAIGAPVPSDRDAARVRHATGGLAGDVADVAARLVAAMADAIDTADLPLPRPRCVTSPHSLAWAIAFDASATCVAGALDAPAGARRVDAAALVRACEPDERRAALRAACAAATALGAAALPTDELITVGEWWAELAAPGAPLEHAELDVLLRAILPAFERNRWRAGQHIAERLWRSTGIAAAARGVAAALVRSAPCELLDEVDQVDDGLARATAAFTRALWQMYCFHRPDDAERTLRAVDATTYDEREMVVEGLATVQLHLGDLDEVDRLLAELRDPDVRADLKGVDETFAATAFGVNTLVQADLTRARHHDVVERLDAELVRHLRPGMNLTPERYRFLRAFAASQQGVGDHGSFATDAELDEEHRLLYDAALDTDEPWHLGHVAWGAGLHDARMGRFERARRRLVTAVEAFDRAHRPGFAMWPATTLAMVDALVDDPHAPKPDVDELARPSHAVQLGRAEAAHAVALLARRDGAPSRDVAAHLRAAMTAARNVGAVQAAHEVVIEQVLAGLDPDRPCTDPRADGVVVRAAAALLGSKRGARELEAVALDLIGHGRPVLGVRVLARAAEVARAHDPRLATRLTTMARSTAATFDRPLRPWVLGEAELPTLSAREHEVARMIADGARRDAVAEALVVSRRTIDSHLQRIYAKLGVTTRDELRDWLSRSPI